MRTIFVILIIAVLALIAAIQLGLVSISQTQPATSPTISTDNGVIRAEPGQTPEFKVKTGKVELGTREANVDVPSVEVKRADEPDTNAN